MTNTDMTAGRSKALLIHIIHTMAVYRRKIIPSALQTAESSLDPMLTRPLPMPNDPRFQLKSLEFRIMTHLKTVSHMQDKRV